MSVKNKILIFYGKFLDEPEHDWLPNHLLYLAAPLTAAGLEVIIIPEFIMPDYRAKIARYADETLFFGISAMSGRQITAGLEVAAIFREYAPQTPIAWGGAHASAMPRQTLEHEFADIVFVGHAETSAPKVATALQEKRGLRDIPGILFKDDGVIINNGPPENYDMGRLPPFPYSLLPIAQYINPKTRALNYTASVGCPGTCTFCSWGGSHRWRHLDVTRVLNDIEKLAKEHRLHTVWINDADFFTRKDFALEVARGLKQRNLGIYWRASSRVVDLIKYTRAEMKMLVSSNLDNIFLGIEATTPKMMRIMLKHYRVEFVDEIIARAKGLPIELYLSMIFGSPGENLEDLETSYANLQRWRTANENVRFQTCVYAPYPGTPMTNIAAQQGLSLPTSLEGWGTFSLLNNLRDRFEGVPWFSNELNVAYGARFRELFPTYPKFEYKKILSRKD